MGKKKTILDLRSKIDRNRTCNVYYIQCDTITITVLYGSFWNWRDTITCTIHVASLYQLSRSYQLSRTPVLTPVLFVQFNDCLHSGCELSIILMSRKRGVKLCQWKACAWNCIYLVSGVFEGGNVDQWAVGDTCALEYKIQCYVLIV